MADAVIKACSAMVRVGTTPLLPSSLPYQPRWSGGEWSPWRGEPRAPALIACASVPPRSRRWRASALEELPVGGAGRKVRLKSLYIRAFTRFQVQSRRAYEAWT